MDMCGKILITCSLVVRRGLHIGGSGIFSPIGAVDSPVIRDPLTQRPIVPGSSLKGSCARFWCAVTVIKRAMGLKVCPKLTRNRKEFSVCLAVQLLSAGPVCNFPTALWPMQRRWMRWG